MQPPPPSPDTQVHNPWTPGPQGYQPWYPKEPYRRSSDPMATSTPWRPRRPTRAWRPRELAAAGAAVVLADIALWSDSPALGGPGAAVLFFALPFALVAGARMRRLVSPRLALASVLLLLTALRFAIAPTVAIGVTAPLLLLSFALALRTRRLFVPAILFAGVAAITVLPSHVGAAARGLGRLLPKSRVSPLPILVPAALVLVFLGVFALANPVVAHALGVALHWLGTLVAFPSAGRVALWVCATIAALLVVRPVFRRARGAETAPHATEASDTALLVARNALLGLVVLFFAYDALDVRYLWAGAPPSGMSTQEYARSGAFWLTIALLLLTVVVGVMFRGPLAGDPRAARIRRLAYVWIAEGGLLAVGTYRRIAIHVARSGLSDLRIVGILGTSLVLFGLGLVVWKLQRQKTFLWLLRRQLDGAALVLAVYAIFPTHWLSAEVNASRVAAGEYRPLLHAFRQATETESVAVWIPLLDHHDPRVRQGVAALLQKERAALVDRVVHDEHWQTKDLGTRAALARLNEVGARIEAELDGIKPADAQSVLYTISRVSNEDATLEEILAIPAAARDANVEGEMRGYSR